MTLRGWLRQPVSRWWEHLLLWPLAFLLLLFVAGLVFEYGVDTWGWLTTEEDLGARLRRACESREADRALSEERTSDTASLRARGCLGD